MHRTPLFGVATMLAVLSSTLASTSAQAAEPSTKPLRIAVYKLEAAAVDPQLARITEQSLVAELRKLQRCSVLAYDEIQSMIDLESQKQLVGCTESSCLADIAEALGADVLVTGGVAVVGGQAQVAWKRIEPATATVTQSYTASVVVDTGEEVLALIGPAVEQLFPDLPLRKSATRGVDPALAKKLNPPPLSPWLVQTTGATAGVLAVATGAAGVLWFVADGNLKDTYATAKNSPVSAAQVTAQQEQTQLSNGAFWIGVGLTTVAAAATGMMIPFTNFDAENE